MMGQFGFQGCPQALHGRIIVAFADIAHTHRDPMPTDERLVGRACMTQRVPHSLGPYGARQAAAGSGSRPSAVNRRPIVLYDR